MTGALGLPAGRLSITIRAFCILHPGNGFVYRQETEAIGCYSLWDNGLSASTIGFVWRFFGARQARAAFFPADAG
jgi:hypothetical protein